MADLRKLLDAANAAFAAAEAQGETTQAILIESETIRPLKSAIAAVALSALARQAALIEEASEALELALVRLARRVDRLFLDRLLRVARETGLATPQTDRPAASREAVPAVEAQDVEPRDRPVRTGGAATGAGGGGAVSGSGRVIDVTDRDLDALARVAQSEVGHFGRHGADQLRGGVAAVVDTILNRVANPGFPDTIEAVADQDRQFSAVTGVGSWTGLPSASPGVFAIVSEHVAARAAGRPSAIRGATHFLNPHKSSPSALLEWGTFVRNNAVAVFGDDAARDVHFHGTAPGTPATPPYVLRRGAALTAFDGSGEAPGGQPTAAALRAAIVRICREELAFFRDGEAKETDETHFRRVGDYWRAVGKPFDGRTKGDDGQRIAWSAAFIGFVLKQAGAGDRFPAAAGHCFYFQHFVGATGPGLYRALTAAEAKPAPGDILHHGRGSSDGFDFAAARLAFAADDFYPSHSAIVTAVDAGARTLETIGGNEGDSVQAKTFALEADGRLAPRRSGSKKLPWIGVLKLA